MKSIKELVTERRNKSRNKKLIKEFPFLLPRNRWTGKASDDYDYSYTELDEMPDGWRKAFGEQMCQEIKEVLVKHNYLDKYRIMQIKEKYGCYDAETEVLTRNGWKLFKDVSYDDEFATLDSDGETLIYQKPSDIIQYHYKGDMYKLVNRGIDLLVTPNHNIYVSKGSYYYGKKNNQKITYPFELTTYEKYFHKDKRFKKGCKWIGKKNESTFKIPDYTFSNYMKINNCMRDYTIYGKTYNMVDFLKFLGFYIAEGCTRLHNGCTISIAYNYNDEEDLVTSLIKNLGYETTNSSFKKNNGIKRIYDASLGSWLKENCGHLAPNKKVPDFIKELSPEYIEIFLTYLFIGDGHKTKTYNILTTTSKQLSNDVCELLLKCGYTFRVSERDPRRKRSYKGHIINGNYRSYNINWLKNTYIEFDMSKKPKDYCEDLIEYDNMVYCVTIPNHILYVRRNGKGYWCGNSLRWYDNGAPEEVSRIISKYEDLSMCYCYRCGKPTKYMTEGWIEYLCEDCKTYLISKGYNEDYFIPLKKSDAPQHFIYKDGKQIDLPLDNEVQKVIDENWEED